MNNSPEQAKIQLTYSHLIQQLTGLLETSTHWLVNSAQTCALLKEQLSDINWVGFYFLYNNALELGPFQGKPACSPIALGAGVCGQAAQQRKSIIVADVDQFPQHIACDSASRSECVIPIIQHDALLGVLDLDSSVINRFSQEDSIGLENIVKCLLQHTDFTQHVRINSYG